VGAEGIALDPSGNIDVVEVGTNGNGNGLVYPVGLPERDQHGVCAGLRERNGHPWAGLFPFILSSTPQLPGRFQAVTLGDLGSGNDVVSAGNGSCVNKTLGSVSAAEPYICEKTVRNGTSIHGHSGVRNPGVRPAASSLLFSPRPCL